MSEQSEEVFDRTVVPSVPVVPVVTNHVSPYSEQTANNEKTFETAKMTAVRKSLWQKVSSLARSISNILENRQVTIMNIIAVVIAFGGEYFIEENNIFPCPCAKELAENYIYGLTFILGGAVILWMIGFMVYSGTWKACHGCWPWKKQKCCIQFSLFFSACVKTIVVPLAWIFAILFDGDYIACMLSAYACNKESEDYKRLKKASQYCAFISSAVLLTVVCIGRMLSRCFNNHNYLHYTLSETYRKAEEKTLFKYIPEVADSLAEEAVKSFLQNKNLKEEDWTAATDENQRLGLFLSPLHKVVESKKCAQVSLQEISGDSKV